MSSNQFSTVNIKFFCKFLWCILLAASVDCYPAESALTPLAMAKIQREAGTEYALKGVEAANPAQDWRLRFHDDGVDIIQTGSSGERPLRFRLARIGNARELEALKPVKPEIARNRVIYQRNTVEEWYVNGPLGLEQGFTVPHSLGDKLVLELDTSWVAENVGENTVQLVDGQKRWDFGALQSVDANGRILPSVMKVVDGKVHLEVETKAARFPVVVDPILTRTVTLVAKDRTAFLGFGRSVAMSGDGNTAIVGTDGNAAYIFNRTLTGWSQVQKLVKPTTLRCNSNGSWFGWSVALSKDGSTAMVGSSGVFTLYIGGIIPVPLFYSCGDLPVYKKQGTKWVLEKILTTPGVTVEDMFGSSVSLSQDGNRAVVGAQLTKCAANTDRCGAVYMFERGASGWVKAKSFVNAVSYDASEGYFGATTAISADGLWALVGAPGGDTAWVFQRQAAPVGWKQVQAIKFPATRLTKDFGTALALSSIGDRAVISAQSTTNISDCKGDYNDCGAVYSFVRTGTKWIFESVFTANDSHSYNYFGESLALSADGKRVIVGTSGADCVNGNCGAAYLFDRIGTAWVQQGRVTGPSAGLGGSELGGNFGGAVTLSQNGSSLLVAARQDNCQGAKECGKVYHYTITP